MVKWSVSGLVLLMSLTVFALSIQAETIWKKEFSDSSDWTIVSDPGSNSSIKAVDGLGALFVGAAKSEAAFVPVQSELTLVPFDPLKASDYVLSWKIDHLTNSVGWDIAVDEFNADKQFINTVWNVYPGTGNCAQKGEYSKSLADRRWKPETRYIAPKINVHTGTGSQTVYLSYIKIDHKIK